MARKFFGHLGGMSSCWGYRLKLVRSQQETEETLPENVECFSYKTLKKATNNFRTRLREGGFSSCYKGTLEDGTSVVAKVLKNHGRQNLAFFEAIKIMSRIKHRNIVEIIGCCVEDDHRIIVYEFVGEHSLYDLLFNPNTSVANLSWSMRASICREIARGLEYLHHGISPRVIHRDIKPSNVLLDRDFNPKLVDFEIACLLDDEVSHYSGEICGTFGYLDPESIPTGKFTEKADVFGYGVLLLEVISGKRNAVFRDDDGLILTELVWELRESDRVLEIVDPNLSEFLEDEVVRFINVALFCIQVPSDLRPRMSEVWHMLSGGYDFSNMVLRRPKHSWRSLSFCEDDFTSPSHDQKSGEVEDGRQQEDVGASSDHLKRDLSGSFGESKGKTMSRYEIEAESDLETYSGAVETGLYRSIEPSISGAVSVSEPSNRAAGKSELMSTSSGKPNFIFDKETVEATGRTQMLYDPGAELYRLIGPNVSVGVSGSDRVNV